MSETIKAKCSRSQIFFENKRDRRVGGEASDLISNRGREQHYTNWNPLTYPLNR